MKQYRAKYKKNRTMVFKINGGIEDAYRHCRLKWGLEDFLELGEIL